MGWIYFFRRLFERAWTCAHWDTETAAIGPATADRLRTWGLKSDIVPEKLPRRVLVEAFTAKMEKGSINRPPRAMEARSVLPVELTRMGASVDEVTADETRQAENSATDLIARLD